MDGQQRTIWGREPAMVLALVQAVIALTEGTVEKHVRSILMKLDVSETEDDHRRVLAILTFLDHH